MTTIHVILLQTEPCGGTIKIVGIKGLNTGIMKCKNRDYIYVISEGTKATLYTLDGKRVKDVTYEPSQTTDIMLFCFNCYCVAGKYNNTTRFVDDLVFIHVESEEKIATPYSSAYPIKDINIPNKDLLGCVTPLHALVSTQKGMGVVGDDPNDPLETYDGMESPVLTYVVNKKTSYVYLYSQKRYYDLDRKKAYSYTAPYNILIHDTKVARYNKQERVVELFDIETGKSVQTSFAFTENSEFMDDSPQTAVFENAILFGEASVRDKVQTNLRFTTIYSTVTSFQIAISTDMPFAYFDGKSFYETRSGFLIAYDMALIPTPDDYVSTDQVSLFSLFKRKSVEVIRSSYNTYCTVSCDKQPKESVSKLRDFSFFVF